MIRLCANFTNNQYMALYILYVCFLNFKKSVPPAPQGFNNIEPWKNRESIVKFLIGPHILVHVVRLDNKHSQNK
jgi:hypothetical protein